MDKLQVKEYRETSEGTAELNFVDGSCLVLIPYRAYLNIEGLDSTLLYQSGTLEALATERPSRYIKTEETGFWSRGKISQQELAAYWRAAMEVGNKVYQDYQAKKIDEETWARKYWGFWSITSAVWFTLERLERGEERVFEENPGRFKDRI